MAVLTAQNEPALRLLPVEGDATLIPSTLWAPKVNLDLRLDAQRRLDTQSQSFQELRFGEAALAAYLLDPTQGYFVKSPKSFLGAPGLLTEVKERFVSIVAAMMANVRQRAQASVEGELLDVVIGRPVNFQGPGGAVENDQAIDMLTQAATQAGFRQINFLFEPMAAAIEYESKLQAEQRVLVVDVGGGTTDCSFVRVGPKLASQLDRSQDVLGHTGERLGGNDYDQALALQAVMPEFGLGSMLRSTRLVPNNYLVDAVSTNDVNAQQRFYSKATAERIDYFAAQSQVPHKLARLQRLQTRRATYQLLREVEQAKIRLSQAADTEVALDFIEPRLAPIASGENFADASERLLAHLQKLVTDVLQQSAAAPQVVYLTGGMAKSTVVREHLALCLPDVPVLDSDYFASVTEGLTLWAKRLYQ